MWIGQHRGKSNWTQRCIHLIIQTETLNETKRFFRNLNDFQRWYIKLSNKGAISVLEVKKREKRIKNFWRIIAWKFSILEHKEYSWIQMLSKYGARSFKENIQVSEYLRRHIAYKETMRRILYYVSSETTEVKGKNVQFLLWCGGNKFC